MLIKKLLLFFYCIAFLLKSEAQDLSEAKPYAASIDQLQLKDHVEVLSSDSLAGRGLGTDGLIKARNYLQSYFDEIGLHDVTDHNYLQSFIIIRDSPGEIYIRINGHTYENGKDFVYLGDQVMQHEKQSKLYYIDQLEDSALQTFPQHSITAFPSARALINKISDDHTGPFLLISNRDEEANLKTFKFLKNASNQHFYFPDEAPVDNETPDAFYVSPQMIAKALNVSISKLTSWEKDPPSDKQLKQITNPELFYKTGRKHDTLTISNVVGFVEGTKYKDEVVIVSAHYDHLGKTDTTYYPGADDNASGVSAVLEIAEAFKKAEKEGNSPRRSLLFLAFTGEEEGLYGSSYYSDNPLVPLPNTVANLNIDMIGRTDNFYDSDSSYIYLIGADKISPELHEISENVNRSTLQLKLDYRYNAEDDPNRFYYRSDHYNFAKHGIPVIFYFNGTHEDYHEVTDTENKINYMLLQKRAQLIFYTAWELANREMKLKTNN